MHTTMITRSERALALTAALAALAVSSGCSTVKYAAMEKLGVHKREILVTDVKKARDAQQEAKTQFKDALTRFREVLNFQGGELESRYQKLKKVLDRSEAKAQQVESRIDSVENVGSALFKEWRGELKEYTSENLRASSKLQYDRSMKKYKDMLAAMKRAEAKIEPVLKPLRDQVLFLKHNLNARAIASLKKELISIEGDVDGLIRELEAAIEEADRFIADMQQG